MKKFICKVVVSSFCIIFIGGKIGLAQEKYYEIKNTSSTYFDEEQNEHIKDDFERQAKIVLSPDYMLYFRNPTHESGPFSFSHLDAWERATGRGFQLRNSYRDPLFKRMEMPEVDFLSGIKKTGKTKIINNHLCDEYEFGIGYDNYDGRLFIYIAEELPFVNLWGMNKDLPGFVVSFQSLLSMDGKRYIQTENFDIQEIPYDSIYFKYTEDLKKQYPMNRLLYDRPVKNNIDIPDELIDQINVYFHPSNSNPLLIQNTGRINCNDLKRILKIRDNDVISDSYFNQENKRILELSYKGFGLKTNFEEDEMDCFKNDFSPIQFSSSDTIRDVNNPKRYYVADAEKRTILSHSHYGTISIYSYDDNNRLTSSKWLNDDGEAKDSILYNYDQNGLLDHRKRWITKYGKLSLLADERFEYYENGLLKTVIKNESGTKYTYGYKQGSGVDTVYVYKDSEEERKAFMYCFDDHNNLISKTSDNIIDHSNEQFILEYYPSKNEKDTDSIGRALEYAFETEYLKLFGKMNEISFGIKESTNRYNEEVNEICATNFMVKKILKQDHHKSDFYFLNYFSSVRLLEYETLKEEDRLVYFKVYYKEDIFGYLDRSDGHFSKTITTLKGRFGNDVVKENDAEWSVRLERDSRYAIVIYNKANNQWKIK